MKNKWLILSLVFSLFAGAALLTSQHFHTHDDLQVFRLNEYLKCFEDGQIPCRWSSEMGKGYGYPYFIFYPPAIYALPAIIHAVTSQSLILSLNLAAYFTFPLAAYAMYRLVKSLTGQDWAAALGSLLYTFVPYHALNIFVRGVYAENLAWALFPLLLACVHDLASRNQSYFKLTLGVSLLLLTHNISAMLMLPILFIWGLLIGVRDLWKLLRLLTSFIFAVGISAWFFLPALLEKNLVQSESMTAGYYSYLNHFVSLKQLFLSNYWGFGASGYETEFDGMSFALGYPITIGIFVIIAYLLVHKGKKKPSSATFITLLVLGLLSLFMTHAKSLSVWGVLPLLAYIQFPWRFLGVASALLIAALGYGLTLLPQKPAKFLALLLFISSLGLYAIRFRPEKYDTYQDQDFLSGQFREDQQSAHLYDYLPKVAHSVPDKFRTSPVFRSDLPVTISELTRTSRGTRFNLASPGDQPIILSEYTYPGRTVTLNGAAISYSPDPDYGFITFPVAAGTNLVETSWQETPVRRAANYLSVISLALFLLYNIYYAKRT